MCFIVRRFLDSIVDSIWSFKIYIYLEFFSHPYLIKSETIGPLKHLVLHRKHALHIKIFYHRAHFTLI